MVDFNHVLAVMSFLHLSSSIDNGVGLTPPMGWRSWNCMHGDISDERIRATIDAITSRQRKVKGVPTSIADLGYDWVGVDDGWQACDQGPNEGGPTFHDKAGKPLVNTTLFPNLADLVSYGHGKSVKMGWYINNCICHESKGHIGGPTGPHGAWVNLTYKGDVDQIAEAGFDGVKVDNCGLHSDIERYADMLNQTGKHVLIEECAQGKVVPTKDWCPFNMFRTGGDIRPTFANVMGKLQRTIPYQALTDPLSRPGCWAYPDMLEVGNIGGSLAHVESRSHFGGWCVVSSPLILGLDLTSKELVDSVWDIISNRG
jgi:alpha-galactosidase